VTSLVLLTRPFPRRGEETSNSCFSKDAKALASGPNDRQGSAERAGLRGFRIIKNQRRFGPFLSEEVQVDRNYADVIVALDGEAVKSADDLLSAIESRQPGEETVVTVLREGRRINVGVVLGQED